MATTASTSDDGLDAVFTKYDTDGSGTIDTAELSAMLGELGIDADASAATTAMIEAFDADKSGGLEIGEFKTLVAEIRAAQGKQGGEMPAWLKSLGNSGDLVAKMSFNVVEAVTAPVKEMGKGLANVGESMGKGFEQAAKSMDKGLEAIGNLGTDEIELVFRKYDVNKSGTIDGGELSSMLKEMGIDADADAATTVINTFDADKSGGLEIVEFRKLVAEIRAAHQQGESGSGSGGEMPPWLQAIANPVANAGDLVKKVSSGMAEAVTSPVKGMVSALTPRGPELTEEEARKVAEEDAIQRAHAEELKSSPGRQKKEAYEEEKRAAEAEAERIAEEEKQKALEESARRVAEQARKVAEEAQRAAEAAKRVAEEKAAKAAEDRANAEAARKAAEAEAEAAAAAAKQAMEEVAKAAEEEAKASKGILYTAQHGQEQRGVSGMAKVQQVTTGSAAILVGLVFALCGMALAALTPADRASAVKSVVNGAVDAYTKRFG